MQVHKTRMNPKEILKEVPVMLQHLEEAVARQELILKLQQQENPPGQFNLPYITHSQQSLVKL